MTVYFNHFAAPEGRSVDNDTWEKVLAKETSKEAQRLDN